MLAVRSHFTKTQEQSYWLTYQMVLARRVEACYVATTPIINKTFQHHQNAAEYQRNAGDDQWSERSQASRLHVQMCGDVGSRYTR